jgi:ubiquinone/menaquinone biosynthesis C-methylase UbiE
MPSIEENKRKWSRFAWGAEGDEWSHAWGGSDRLWHGTIWPRVGAFLPAPTILEIAPGHGRVTHHLVGLCERLVLVDLLESCVETCRTRFANHAHVECHVNDGRSLSMLADASIDVAISWDSLVHAERDVVAAYLKELARVLRVGGVAFLHHSNLNQHRKPFTGKLLVDNLHWRAESVCAEIVRKDARAASLECIAQELIPWGGSTLIDCFSLIRKPATATEPAPAPVIANHDFEREVAHIARLGALYSSNPAIVHANDERIARDARTARWGS